MKYLSYAFLAFVLLSCLTVKKKKSLDLVEKTDQENEQIADNYSENELKAVRKLISDVFYNDYDPELNDSQLKAALLNNIQATANIIKNDQIIVAALGKHIGEPILKQLRQAFKPGKEKEQRIYNYLVTAINIDNRTQQLIAAIHATPINLYKEQDDHIEKLISKYDFSEIDDALEAFKKIPVPDNLGNATRFFQDVLANYFRELASEDKRRIIATLLRNTTARSTFEDLASALVMGAGPVFQKYIQKLSDMLNNSDPEQLKLKRAFNVAKSSLPKNPEYETKRNFAEIERRTNGRLHLEMLKNLGQASIGVAMLVNITDREKNKTYPAVYKELRANIRSILDREDVFFKKIALRHNFSAVYEQKRREILAETDFSNELKNVQLGKKYYNENKDLPKDTIRAVSSISLPDSPNYMAMDIARGVSLEKYFIKGDDLPEDSEDLLRAKINILVASQLMHDMVVKWLRVAFFIGRDGIFHGDLHAGNVFIKVDTEWYFEKLKSMPWQDVQYEHILPLLREEIPHPHQLLTMIDFGVITEMKRSNRSGLLNLIIATTPLSSSANAFMAALEELAPSVKYRFDQDKSLRQEAQRDIQNILNAPRSDPLSDIVTYLTEKGIDLPYTMVSFSDSMLMLENSFNNLRTSCEKLDISRGVVPSLLNFKDIVTQVIGDHLGYSTGKHYLGNLAKLNPLGFFIPSLWSNSYIDQPAISPENIQAIINKQIWKKK